MCILMSLRKNSYFCASLWEYSKVFKWYKFLCQAKSCLDETLGILSMMQHLKSLAAFIFHDFCEEESFTHRCDLRLFYINVHYNKNNTASNPEISLLSFMKVADSMKTGSINHHLVNKWDKKNTQFLFNSQKFTDFLWIIS